MILPLTNNPSESFSFNIDGVIYKFRQRWNTYGFWTIDISDVDGIAFVHGVKLVTRENILDMHPSIPFDLRSERISDPSRNNLNEFELQIIEKNNV
jgi:Domain of unknown function (DUF6983)